MGSLVPTAPRGMMNVTPGAADYLMPEQGLITAQDAADDNVNLTRLVEYYTNSEDASHIAREKSERDRDYVDNKQLTEDEVRALKKRGQPPVTLNVVRSRAAFLSGMEKKQRRDPKAYPRNNPDDVPAAEAFTDGMRYVISTADYPSKRSQAWKNITVEGFGGIELAAVQKADGDTEFKVNRIPWDRLFYDPHSSEPDFSDARFVGQVMWMDYDEALARAASAGYVDEAGARDILDTTLSSALGAGRTYDDKPKWTQWAQPRRQRVRVVMMWHKEASGWEYTEFTKGGILAHSAGAYVDQDGDTYCPWVLESANVDRDNNRYGELRNLIDPQDEINKRRSKGLHLLNTRGVIASKGAVDDINATRRELAKPDFYVEVNEGASKFELQDGVELATGQAQMGAEAMAYVREAGPNQALLGKGVQDQSGKAIEAQQAGGLVEQSDLMDTLRRLDLRVFTIVASMMKQFWNSEKWIRVTDDPDAPQWIGLNEPMLTDGYHEAPRSDWRQHFAQGGHLPHDPTQMQRMQPAVDPQTGEPKLANHVAKLNMDIIVSDAPDSITLDSDNYQAFLQLMGLRLPPSQLKIAIEMNPGLPAKRKKELIDLVEQSAQEPPPPAQQRAMELKIEKLEADIVAVRAGAFADLALGDANLAKAGQPQPPPPPLPSMAEGFGQPAPAPATPPGAPPPAGPGGMPVRGPGPMPPQGPAALPPPHVMPPPGQGPGPPPGPPAGMMTGHPQVAA